MKKVIVKVIASAEVELDDDYDVYDIDQYVKDEYYNLAYPESEFKLVGYEVDTLVGYEVDTIDRYKKRIYELEVENSKLKEKLDLERDVDESN